jgi:cell division transport system ATP-binding protein
MIDILQEKSIIIQMFHVHKRFSQKIALVDISLDIFKNEFVFICGPSGAGKTTLLKLLYLGEPLSEGQILIERMNLSRIPRKRVPYLRREFGIVFQDFKLIPTKTVFENVSLVLEAKGKTNKMARKKVNSVLRTVGMEDKNQAYPPTLSGGEQQRVAVARAIVGDPKIILADEPTGSLDSASAKVIMDLLHTFHARGGTVIVATHDESLLQDKSVRIIRLDAGRLVSSTHHQD